MAKRIVRDGGELMGRAAALSALMAIAGLLSACAAIYSGVAAAGRSDPAFDPASVSGPVSDLSDIDLMTAYGAALREAYHTRNDAIYGDPVFRSLAQEARARGLAGKRESQRIEKGIIFIGLPLHFAVASINNLEEKDVFEKYGDVVRTYVGEIGYRGRFDYVISCNNKVVSFQVTGFPERSSRRGHNTRAYQTNFRDGFWSDPRTQEQRILANFPQREPKRYAHSVDGRWRAFRDNRLLLRSPSSYWSSNEYTLRDPFVATSKKEESLCP